MFYAFASLPESKIAPQLVRTALDNLGWFWVLVEALVLLLLTEMGLLLLGATIPAWSLRLPCWRPCARWCASGAGTSRAPTNRRVTAPSSGASYANRASEANPRRPSSTRALGREERRLDGILRM